MNNADEILEEVRAARATYTATFDYDIKRMVEDLKKKQEEKRTSLADVRPLTPKNTA